MVQQLRKPTALAKDLGSVPTPTLAHITRSRRVDTFFQPLWSPEHPQCTLMLAHMPWVIFCPPDCKLELSKKKEQ